MNPSYLRRRLANGLVVFYRHTPQSLMAEFHLMLPGGQLREPAGKRGLSNLTMELAVKGTRLRSYADLCERIESLGGSIWGDDAEDHASLNLSVPADKASEALPLFAEVVLEPSYPSEELEKERKATLAEIKSKSEHPFAVAYEKLNELLFGDHAYGEPDLGTPGTLSKITRPDLVRWNEAWIKPEQAVLSIAAPLGSDEVFKQLKVLFDKPWNSKTGWPSPQRPLKPRKEKRVRLKKHFKQAYFLMGFRAPNLSSPIFPHVKVLNTLLGGGMSTRLFQNIREKQGLAYEVGSFYPTRLLGSGFVIHMGLKASNIPKAEHCVRRLLQELIHDTPPPEEVEEAKRYIRGIYFMDHQTNFKKAFYTGWWEILGKGAAFDAQYPKAIGSVTPEGVREAARAVFKEPAQIVELHPN